MTLIETDVELESELQYIGTAPAYRPPEARWDDDNEVVLIDDLSRYDSHAVRKCFDCMVNLVVPGTLRCESCNYKRDRRLAVNV
jgi:hypothetical protein